MNLLELDYIFVELKHYSSQKKSNGNKLTKILSHDDSSSSELSNTTEEQIMQS